MLRKSTKCISSLVFDALKDLKWIVAMMEEMHALDTNETWSSGREVCGWMQVGVYCEMKSRSYRSMIQNKVSGKRVYSNIWYGLF